VATSTRTCMCTVRTRERFTHFGFRDPRELLMADE